MTGQLSVAMVPATVEEKEVVLVVIEATDVFVTILLVTLSSNSPAGSWVIINVCNDSVTDIS